VIGPRASSRTRARATMDKNSARNTVRPKAREDRSLGRRRTRKSEGRIGARKPGNEWHRSRRSKGAPVPRENFRRNHDRYLDSAGHVTEITGGNGESEAQPADALLLASAPHRRGGAQARLPPDPQGCGGGCGWRHEGALWRGTGAQRRRPARQDEGDALPPSAGAPRAHSEGPGEDTPDRDLVRRGQDRAGRAPGSAGGRVRADLQ